MADERVRRSDAKPRPPKEPAPRPKTPSVESTAEVCIDSFVFAPDELPVKVIAVPPQKKK